MESKFEVHIIQNWIRHVSSTRKNVYYIYMFNWIEEIPNVLL